MNIMITSLYSLFALTTLLYWFFRNHKNRQHYFGSIDCPAESKDHRRCQHQHVCYTLWGAVWRDNTRYGWCGETIPGL